MAGARTVWDVEEDLPTPASHHVTGRLHEQPLSGAPDAGGLVHGGGLEIMAQLAVSLGSVAEQLRREEDRRDKLTRAMPGDYQYATQATCPTPTAPFSLNLGSADQGQWWNIRRVVVGGPDVSSSPAGVAWVSVQGSPPAGPGAGGGLNPPIPTLVDKYGTLPAFQTYGTHQLVVDETEYLWVTIIGGTAGTVYVASVKAETYLRSAMLRAAVEE